MDKNIRLETAKMIYNLDPYAFWHLSNTGALNGSIPVIAKNLNTISGCIETINFLLDIIEDQEG